MNSFSERLKEAMKLKNITQSELCERTGIPKSAMSQYVSGAFTPKQERTYLISKALDVNEPWLLGYDDVSMERNDAPTPKVKKIPYTEATCARVPLIGRAAAGYSCHAEENITEYILTDSDILKDGYEHFWLTVKGDSMEPTLLEGDLVLVRAQTVLDTPCLAVVTVDQEDGLVKYVDIDEHKITLNSVNPYYPPRVFEDKEMNRVSVVGQVIESKRRY